MPTPVGPLGPDEFDHNDPDLWDWDPEPDVPVTRPAWLRVTAWIIAFVLAIVVIAAVFR